MDLRQKTCQLFQSIDKLFHHNNTLEVAREDPILLNKIAKGDIKWGRQKTVFDWAINTFNQVFTLPQVRRENIYSRLEPHPQEARASKQKWFLLFVLLRSSVPPISVAADMFIRLQHAFKTEYYRHVILKSQVHYEINLCNYLISSLANHPKNSREIISHPPT